MSAARTTAPPEIRQSDLVIDRFLPAFDVTLFHHTVVDASPETTYAAVRGLDLMEVMRTSRATRALFLLRTAPDELLARLRGTAPPPPEKVTLVGDADVPGWNLLGEEPGREIVVGAIGKFWKPKIEWRDVAPDDFASFAEPGYGKIAWNFSVAAYGSRRSLLTTECRTGTTDPISRRKFRRYWRVVGPFAGYIIGLSPPVIRKNAEQAA